MAATISSHFEWILDANYPGDQIGLVTGHLLQMSMESVLTPGQIVESLIEREWKRLHPDGPVSASLKLGDTVKLKSGGPVMVVVGFSQAGNDVPLVRCMWWGYDDKFQEEKFKEATLVKAEPESKSTIPMTPKVG
jgi:uncharacterized protein YodC (DUF2158 family)